MKTREKTISLQDYKPGAYVFQLSNFFTPVA